MPPGKSSVRDCDEKELVVPRLSASCGCLQLMSSSRREASPSAIKVEESVDSLGFGFVDLPPTHPVLRVIRGRRDAEITDAWYPGR